MSDIQFNDQFTSGITSNSSGLTASISVSSSSANITPHSNINGSLNPTEHLVGTLGVTGGSIPAEGDKHFVYQQNVPSNRWVITHNLNKYPAVSVVDSAGTVVIGDCEYINTNSVILTFSGEFSGKAYFN